jgi:ribose transport system substrate-binding protein
LTAAGSSVYYVSSNEMHDRRYTVEAILRACDVLKAFHFDSEVLALRDIVERTGLNKVTAFRTVYSLAEGGFVERLKRDQYRRRRHAPQAKWIRIGYAAMTDNSIFSRDVTDGLRSAAAEQDIELIEYDNRYSSKIAIRNAERLVKDKVDLAIEVQIHEETAPEVASKFQAAGIPLIAVDIPHPGAVFFGGNNYEAGRIGGQALAQWARKRLDGQVELVVLLGLSAAGAIPAARMTGVAVGIRELLRKVEPSALVHLDGKGGYVESLEVVRKLLATSRARWILLGAMNDASALGALRAIEESGLAETTAIVGQNATAAARAELRRPKSPLIGSVAFFPETYGQHLVALALQILQGKPVPPAVFVKHIFITAHNVDHYYPNDALLRVPDMDTLLWHSYH